MMLVVQRYLLVLVLNVLVACANKGSDDISDPSGIGVSAEGFNVQAMLANYADNVLLPAYEQAQAQHQALMSATQNYCTELNSASELTTLAFPRQSWLDAMRAWQSVELMRLGILTRDESQLRHQIYSFNAPNISFSRCSVDLSVVRLNSDNSADISSRPLSARGFAALEYLFFDEALLETCPSQITDTQGWNDLPRLQRAQQRCHYAQRVNQEMGDSLQTLLNDWSIDDKNFRSIFINPNNLDVQLKALSDALFSIEKETKDAKLGIPLSLKRPGCSEVACPDLVESPFSQNSLRHIETNLLAFQLMLKGGEGLGFDDLLEQVGAGFLVSRFDELIEQSIAIINSDTRSYYEQARALQDEGDLSICVNAQANPDVEGGIAVCRLHGVLKKLTDLLRMDFLNAVNIDLPERVGGDGD